MLRRIRDDGVNSTVTRSLAMNFLVNIDVPDPAAGRRSTQMRSGSRPRADPFGNHFCLIAFRGRGYDEIAESA